MEMLAVIPKVHFKESQNLRIKGSCVEVFIHIEPRRLGGNTRTFAGVPDLNPAPCPTEPFILQVLMEQGSCDQLSAQLGDGAKLTRNRHRMARNLRVQGNSQPQHTPAQAAQG